MTTWLFLANFGAVALFGIVLSASFCDIKWDRKNRHVFAAGVVALGVIQVLAYLAWGELSLRIAYPLLAHLPLVLLLWYLCRRWLWSLIAVLTAYLCCQIRRWIPLLLVSIFSGNGALQAAVELLLTIPLLLVVIRVASPAVRSLSRYPLAMQIQFGLVPLVGYIFDYLTRIYTDWLIKGIPAATEFMLFVCAVAQLVFARHSNDVSRRQREQEQLRVVSDLQAKQAARQIAAMKKSQEQAARNRHDLRHHLQYLSGCLENGDLEQARKYIGELNQEITMQPLAEYCDNIAANLILSSFAARADEAGIAMTIHVRLSRFARVSDSDLCVVLSNALENALHACADRKTAGEEAVITVQGYEKENRIFLEIANSCQENVYFEKGLPVTERTGHGIGVRSICAIAEKYGGLYTFTAEKGRFVLRLFL